MNTILNFISEITDRQLIRTFVKDEGIPVEEAKGTLHLDVIVSKRYWRKQLRPRLYETLYKKLKTKEVEVQAKLA